MTLTMTTMRIPLAVSVIVLITIQVEHPAAQAPAWYWCEPARAYYPYVATCTVPWRPVNPATVLPRPYSSIPQPSPSQQPAPLPPSAALPPSPGPAGVPSSPPAQGDALDEWCKATKLPSSIAICSDAELRTLAQERQRAYDEAKARLGPEEQKALLADQNGWVKTYPVTCGLAQDARPSLPLTPTIKDCMAQAGRARIAYLRSYGAPTSAAGQAARAVGSQSMPPGTAEQTPPQQPALTGNAASDAAACNDHRAELHNELTAAQQESYRLTHISNFREALAIGPRFNQIKDEVNTRIASLDLEIQREANCMSDRQAARQRAHEQNILTSLGYKITTIEDFELDGKELAASQARIAISGYYFFYSQHAEYLHSSSVIENSQDGILLITEDATRVARAAFLKCRQRGLGNITSVGCPVRIVGHAGSCEMVMTGLTRPCVEVEELTESVMRAKAEPDIPAAPASPPQPPASPRSLEPPPPALPRQPLRAATPEEAERQFRQSTAGAQCEAVRKGSETSEYWKFRCAHLGFGHDTND